ncbi:MAG: hypothetical protein Q9224_007746, partial [Gallowayella concinna]
FWRQDTVCALLNVEMEVEVEVEVWLLTSSSCQSVWMRDPLMHRLERRTNLPPERMTPVKIRGRRGQKARLRAQREERERFAATDDLDKISSTSASDATYVQSKLESLPTEIIESIFLYSRNLDLPRASLALGEILSSSGFKHVVLRAWLTDPYLDDNRNEDEAREDGKLQSGLLRCRWVDEAMFTHVLHDVRISKLTAFFQNPSPSSMSRVTDAAPSNALLGPGCPIADTSTKTITAFVENLQDNGNIHKRKWDW